MSGQTVITLGVRYRDSATGFAGCATARTVYLSGAISVQLEAVGDRGIVSEWIAESRLEQSDERAAGFKP